VKPELQVRPALLALQVKLALLAQQVKRALPVPPDHEAQMEYLEQQVPQVKQVEPVQLALQEKQVRPALLA
jgi:hypothetical protein